MEILGIGIPELLLIVLLALILFGPKDMAQTGRTIGSWLNSFIRSDAYKALTRTGREIQTLPTRLMREANLEEYKQQMQEFASDVEQQGNQIGGQVRKSFDEKQVFANHPSSEASAANPDGEGKPSNDKSA
jgi:sec-independent protein translocase protein TatA